MRYVSRFGPVAVSVVVSLAVAPSAAPAQWGTPNVVERAVGAAAHNGGFSFRTDARDSLHRLWLESVEAREERVACIGGVRLMGTAYVTRVRALEPSAADSLHISAATSIKQCAAPEWFGTVHTHIAKFNGRPFVTFSPDDRRVMVTWRKRWHAEGVFCVLYSPTEAHCEAGEAQSGDPVYATLEEPRGTAVVSRRE